MLEEGLEKSVLKGCSLADGLLGEAWRPRQVNVSQGEEDVAHISILQS